MKRTLERTDPKGSKRQKVQPQNLPDDMLMVISSFLPLEDLLQMNQVNNKLNSLTFNFVINKIKMNVYDAKKLPLRVNIYSDHVMLVNNMYPKYSDQMKLFKRYYPNARLYAIDKLIEWGKTHKINWDF